MRVELFREILFWPVRIVEDTFARDLRRKKLLAAKEKIVEHWVQHLTATESRWEEFIESPGLSPTKYAEVVYFHPSVQRLLYGGATQSPLLRRLTRKDVGGVRIHLSPEVIVDLRAARVDMYVDAHVAMIVLEVYSPGPLELDQVLVIRDGLRRLYPPYWDTTSGHKAGLCPERVEWLDSKLAPLASARPSDFNDPDKYLKHVETHKCPPVGAHWAWLFEPLTAEAHAAETDRPTFRQLGDERIPEMAYLAVDKPQSITDSEFVRLAFLDGPGEGFPYSSNFLADFDKEYCYDRFWNPTAGWTTRYLNCGWGFTMVGEAGSVMYTTHLLDHFRGHYGQMGLIAHFQKASLLVLADRLYDGVSPLREGNYNEFRRAMQALHEDLALFTSRYWFTELSNQVQPQELFELWLKRLGSRELYKQVMDETRTVNEVLHGLSARRQSRDIWILTMVATVGLSFSLAINFLGMNLHGLSTHLPRWWAGVLGWHNMDHVEKATLIITVAIFGAVVSAFMLLFKWLARKTDGDL